ncbi:serine hydrolase domain-containing protein [Angustibacter sp. McL0619]|uniref:serine hydrolase domain-containing protein n=1 Tax=Angustibacter sp. McL0619 TaxID=3415676 RepID=UPI003CE6FFD8
MNPVRIGSVLVAGMLVLVAGCTGSSSGTASPTTTAAAGSSTRFHDPDVRPLPAPRAKALQEVLDELVTLEAQVPGAGASGVTAAVVSDHGGWTGAAGTDGFGVRLRPETVMLIASITKTFLAAEVLHLVAMGRVDIDAPLSRYVSDPRAANGATVRQTLAMRGGFRDKAGADIDEVIRGAAAQPHRHWTARDSLSAWSGASTKPGELEYTSVGYMLLGLLVERVTGRSVAQSLRADLFGPAGLRRIAAQDAERPPAPLASASRKLGIDSPDGYLPGRSLASLGNASSSGIAADAATIATWGYHLYGGRILPATLTKAMITSPSQETLGGGTGYGLGTMVFDGMATDLAAGHLGDLAGYDSILVVVPARELSIAVLTVAGPHRDPFVSGASGRLEEIARNLLRALT